MTKGDSRVTKIGQFIRKTSIDEIPQFLNVLKGEKECSAGSDQLG